MNSKTWERIQYWRKKLPWPYDRLVGTEYTSIHTNLSKNARKKLKKWLLQSYLRENILAICARNIRWGITNTYTKHMKLELLNLRSLKYVESVLSESMVAKTNTS